MILLQITNTIHIDNRKLNKTYQDTSIFKNKSDTDQRILTD